MNNTTHYRSVVGILTAAAALMSMAAFAQEKLEEATPEEIKGFGTFWSTTGQMPPTPFHPFPDLPTYKLNERQFRYEDRMVDYGAIREESAKRAAQEAALAETNGPQPAGPGGGGPMMCESAGLCLLTPQFDGGNVVLKIAGAEEGARYDVFVCTNLSPPLQWRFVTRGAEGQTNLPFAAPAGAVALFQLGTMQDTDGDTLTDAYETLVSHTDPNVADTVETAAGNAELVAVLTPRPPLLYLHTWKGNFQNTLLNRPNPCDFGSPINETGGAIDWTNFAGGIFRSSNRQHTCDPDTQTERITNYVTEGVWYSNETGCVSSRVDEGPWSETNCGPNAEIGEPPKSFAKVSLSRQVTSLGLSFQANSSIEAKVRLETRGPPYSLRKRFWRIKATAADFGDGSTGVGTAVPPQLITVMNQPLNSDGYAYFLLQDGTTNDVTPVLPPQFTNYSFTVNEAVADLKLLVNGIDYTDIRQTVFAGLPIGVSCVLDPDIAVITNYTWTIPNEPISNWVATATLGQVIPLPEWAYTNGSVNYYWWKRATDITVQCSVMVENVRMDAKTHFDVEKPVASITATVLSSVTVDNDWSEAPSTPALHFGGSVGGLPGIRFERTHNPIARWDWLQTVRSTRRLRDFQTQQWAVSSGEGLDGPFPYRVAEVNFKTSDSPGMSLGVGMDDATVNDSFTMHLMYKPSGANTIYVPVASVEWSWGGRASVVAGNWNLVNDPAYPSTPQVGSSAEATGYPMWNANFDNWKTIWNPE